MRTGTQQLRILSTLIAVMVLGACSQQQVRDTQIERQMQESFETDAPSQTAADELPPEVSNALLPPMQVNLPGIDANADMEQRFDVRVRRARARDFFLSLVENTPYNMVVHHDIGGYISLDLKNVTVPEVMQVVRTVNGYDYKMTGKTVQVFPNSIHTRMYQLDYLALQRAGKSVITSKTGQISMSGVGSDDNEGDADTNTSNNSSSIATSTDTDFWRELKQSLETLVGKEDGRRVAINAQTGVVLVRAMPSELRVVEEYLQNSQHIAQRQVIIEARILEVLLDDGFQSGINWAALHENSDGIITMSQTGGGTVFDGSGGTELSGANGLLTTSATPAIINDATSAFGGTFTLALGGNDFSTFIELLKRQGDVQVLSSPRVSTVNNQKAVIKVGSDEFYVTGLDTDTTTAAGTGATNLSVELDPFFSGVALDVTPQISKKGDIVLHVHPAVSEVSEQTKTVTTAIGNLSLPLAASNIRESDTIIRASNGQVVVIGGLMQNTTQDEQASVPLLGDIPLLGNLFRHTKKSTRKSELVILLKPTVVDADGRVWRQELERSSSSLRGMAKDM